MNNWINEEAHSSEFSQEEIDDLRQHASENLRALRERIGVNQEVFAKIMGVSRAALSYYENNSRTPDIDFINKVALHTECSLDFLMGWCPSMSRNHVELTYLLDLDEDEIKRLYDLLEYEAFRAILHSEDFESIFRMLRFESESIIKNGTSSSELLIWKCMKVFEKLLNQMLSYELDKLLKNPANKRIVEERIEEQNEHYRQAMIRWEDEKAKQNAEEQIRREARQRDVEKNPFALFRYKMFEESHNPKSDKQED